MSENFKLKNTLCKVDESLGLVLGWGIICKENGEEYFDLQGDHITEDAMLEAATDFMANSRIAKDMHIKGDDGVLPGSVVFAFPLTTEIAKAFGITVAKTGLLVGMKPGSPDILNKFKTGEYTGFSIGGHLIPNGDA